MMRWHVWAREATGAGNRPFTNVPGSASISRHREHSLVVRHFRVEHRLERVAHCGLGRVHGDVHVALDLGTRTREVEVHPIPRDGHPEPDGDVHGLDPVAVHHVLERVFAVRNLGDGVAESPLGAGDDLVERGADHVGRVVIHDLEEPPGAQAARRDLRVVVAPPLFGHPHVEQQQVHDVALEHAFAEESDHRDAQPLLEDFAHPAAIDPGAMPPTSAWCARLATKPNSSPSTNTGIA